MAVSTSLPRLNVFKLTLEHASWAVHAPAPEEFGQDDDREDYLCSAVAALLDKGIPAAILCEGTRLAAVLVVKLRGSAEEATHLSRLGVTSTGKWSQANGSKGPGVAQLQLAFRNLIGRCLPEFVLLGDIFVRTKKRETTALSLHFITSNDALVFSVRAFGVSLRALEQARVAKAVELKLPVIVGPVGAVGVVEGWAAAAVSASQWASLASHDIGTKGVHVNIGNKSVTVPLEYVFEFDESLVDVGPTGWATSMGERFLHLANRNNDHWDYKAVFPVGGKTGDSPFDDKRSPYGRGRRTPGSDTRTPRTPRTPLDSIMSPPPAKLPGEDEASRLKKSTTSGKRKRQVDQLSTLPMKVARTTNVVPTTSPLITASSPASLGPVYSANSFAKAALPASFGATEKSAPMPPLPRSNSHTNFSLLSSSAGGDAPAPDDTPSFTRASPSWSPLTMPPSQYAAWSPLTHHNNHNHNNTPPSSASPLPDTPTPYAPQHSEAVRYASTRGSMIPAQSSYSEASTDESSGDEGEVVRHETRPCSYRCVGHRACSAPARAAARAVRTALGARARALAEARGGAAGAPERRARTWARSAAWAEASDSPGRRQSAFLRPCARWRGQIYGLVDVEVQEPSTVFESIVDDHVSLTALLQQEALSFAGGSFESSAWPYSDGTLTARCVPHLSGRPAFDRSWQQTEENCSTPVELALDPLSFPLSHAAVSAQLTYFKMSLLDTLSALFEDSTCVLMGPLAVSDLAVGRETVPSTGNLQPTYELLSPPPLMAKNERDNEIVRVDHAAVAWWDKTQLRPLAGTKHLSYYVVCPPSEDLRHATRRFVDNLSSLYQQQKFGRHVFGTLYPRGFVAVEPISVEVADGEDAAAAARQRIRQCVQSYATACQALASKLGTSSEYAVVYIIDPFCHHEWDELDLWPEDSLAENVPSLLSLLYRAAAPLVGDGTRVAIQLISSSAVLHSRGLCRLQQNITFSVYTKLRRFTSRGDAKMRQALDVPPSRAPLFIVGTPTYTQPAELLFLNDSLDVLRLSTPERVLHCCFLPSDDDRRVAVAITDARGEMLSTYVLTRADTLASSVLHHVWLKCLSSIAAAERVGRTDSWRVVVCKFGCLVDEEKTAWETMMDAVLPRIPGVVLCSAALVEVTITRDVGASEAATMSAPGGQYLAERQRWLKQKERTLTVQKSAPPPACCAPAVAIVFPSGDVSGYAAYGLLLVPVCVGTQPAPQQSDEVVLSASSSLRVDLVSRVTLSDVKLESSEKETTWDDASDGSVLHSILAHYSHLSWGAITAAQPLLSSGLPIHLQVARRLARLLALIPPS